jgi:flavin-binding protein dodecin
VQDGGAAGVHRLRPLRGSWSCRIAARLPSGAEKQRRIGGAAGPFEWGKPRSRPADAPLAGRRWQDAPTPQEARMSDHVYKSIEITGSSTTGIEDAVNRAIAKASETVRNIQWFTVEETRGHVRDGKVAHWQVTVKIGFTLE